MSDLLCKEEYEKALRSTFSVVRGCILRDGAWTKETINEWFKATEGKKPAIESVINHVHIDTLFWRSEAECPTEKELIDVGRKIQERWKQYFSETYPDKNMVVIFDETIPSDGWLGDLQVTAFEDRNA